MRRYTVTVDGTPFTIDIQETAADRFSVTVGEQTYEASIEAAEDLPGASITPGMPVGQDLRGLLAQPGPGGSQPSSTAVPGGVSTPSSSVAPAVQARPTAPVAPASAAPRSGGGFVVPAPMPGVILEVNVAAGAPVRRGDPLLVLEAMKMRNTIRSPRDGVVLAVEVDAGRPVLPGEPLVRLGDAPR